MAWCFRRNRAMGFSFLLLLFSAALFAQERRDQDYDRDHGDSHDRQERADCERHGDRNRPRTSALDYLFLPGFPGQRSPIQISAGQAANAVAVIPFHLDRFIRIGHVSLSINTAEPGSHAYAGLYDAHGNLVLQGKFSTDVMADVTVDVSPRVLLKPGMYYYAIGAEDTVSNAVGYLFDTGALNFIHAGLAANQIMDGSLPATLGTVSDTHLIGSTPTAVFTP